MTKKTTKSIIKKSPVKAIQRAAKNITAESLIVDNFSIRRSMGQSSDWKRLDIKKKHVEDLNKIGYTGKLKGKNTTLDEYFHKHIDGKRVKHKIEVVSMNGMEFTDQLLVTRITIK